MSNNQKNPIASGDRVEAIFIKTYTKIDKRFNKPRITFVFNSGSENLLRTFSDARDARSSQVKFVSDMIGAKVPNEIIYNQKSFERLIFNQVNKKFLLTLAPANNPDYKNIVAIKPANDDDYNQEYKQTKINDDDLDLSPTRFIIDKDTEKKQPEVKFIAPAKDNNLDLDFNLNDVDLSFINDSPTLTQNDFNYAFSFDLESYKLTDKDLENLKLTPAQFKEFVASAKAFNHLLKDKGKKNKKQKNIKTFTK
jgi:hypothetical protein